MHKVLVPFDGSKHAMRALGYVIELSGELNKPLEVHVLNVQASPIDYSLYLAPDMIDGVKAGLTNEGKRVLADAVALLTAAGVPFQAHVDLGNVAEQVEAAVQRLDCDAVVMGTRGLGNFGGLLLGSVATGVIHEASVPVTLIK
ncbi:universal stress protein [Pseudomonas syringae]|uniref:universal stress protein n=1 Tax=Pseudomonas syringae TaxID=317 RepID=UPI000E31C30B|nr:universal stress protein [Pseudomonas syringae]